MSAVHSSLIARAINTGDVYQVQPLIDKLLPTDPVGSVDAADTLANLKDTLIKAMRLADVKQHHPLGAKIRTALNGLGLSA